jgi:OPA family glycerol-3-phosphate transporter-like MFS transporter
VNVFHGRSEAGGVLSPFLKSSSFWIVCFLSLGTTIVRESFNTWTPTYLHKFLGYGDGAAARISAVFPLLGAVSVLVAGVAGDRLGVAGRSIVLFLGMVLTTVGLSLMVALHPGSQGMLPIVLIGVVGLGLLGPYSYLAGAMALDLGGRRGGATSSGLIDGVGYLGGVLAGVACLRPWQRSAARQPWRHVSYL